MTLCIPQCLKDSSGNCAVIHRTLIQKISRQQWRLCLLGYYRLYPKSNSLQHGHTPPCGTVWWVGPGWTQPQILILQGSAPGMCSFQWGCSFHVVFEVHLNLEGTKGVVTWKYKTSFPSFSSATSSAISSLDANWSQNNNYAGRDPKYTKREQGIAKLRSLTRICVCSSWRFWHSPVLLHTLSLLLPWQHLSPHPLTTHQRWQGDTLDTGRCRICLILCNANRLCVKLGSASLNCTVSPRCKNL